MGAQHVLERCAQFAEGILVPPSDGNLRVLFFADDAIPNHDFILRLKEAHEWKRLHEVKQGTDPLFILVLGAHVEEQLFCVPVEQGGKICWAC